MEGTAQRSEPPFSFRCICVDDTDCVQRRSDRPSLIIGYANIRRPLRRPKKHCVLIPSTHTPIAGLRRLSGRPAARGSKNQPMCEFGTERTIGGVRFDVQRLGEKRTRYAHSEFFRF